MEADLGEGALELNLWRILGEYIAYACAHDNTICIFSCRLFSLDHSIIDT